MLISVENSDPKATLSILIQPSTANMTDIPEIADIGFLDTQRHVEAFQDELHRCASMSIDVVLSAVHQILGRIADRQRGQLCMIDVNAVLSSIQRAR